jgi:hypothetical protein
MQEMSSTESLAQKIAQLLEAERQPANLSSIQASLDAINARLEKLEASQTAPTSQFPIPQSTHPSLDKFAIAEAIADQIFASQGAEKACTFEPSKPCDHCSMCSSRGF